MSCGSGAPSSVTGASLPVWTCEIQSNRIARILLHAKNSTARSHVGGLSSRKTLHFAAERRARLPTSLNRLPQRSSSSSAELAPRAAAKASAPASPMQLSRKDSRRMDEPAPSKAAIALAPSSPMWLSPKHSSPIPACRPCGVRKAPTTAFAPLSPRPRPLSSSLGLRGGARRHSSLRVIGDAEHIRARSAKAGSQSMQCCRSSAGRSPRLNPLRAGLMVSKPPAPDEGLLDRTNPGA
mmetsp:Transcript_68592/g.212087  ORF Transcript_68592/g.212087 Transcript_68592/m.212087 type:complete len:238 (-) Transcript_68592:222-935(-)